ncbi:MAG: putative S-layer protein [Paenibacillus sp.]|jgi:hypothetical protein|nr:putative S-layer protein [Paenibacillus sp.]
MNKIVTILLAAALAVCPIIDQANAAGSEAAGNVQFRDIQGHWSEEDMKTAVSKGIIAGYPDGTFLPDNEVSRVEAAAMLSRLTKQSFNLEPKAFPEIEQHWGHKSIRQLVAGGFIAESDYPGGFNPDLKLTRYEMMKWLASGLANSEESFKQALRDTANTLLPTPESFTEGIEPEQIPYIAVVKGTGIVDGFPDGSFRPQAMITRAELTSILLRYESVEGRSADQFQSLNELREVGLAGTNVTSITPFRYAQIREKDEKGRFKKEYISFIGIYLNDKTDYKAMEPFLQNPDIVVRYTDGKDPSNQRFEKFNSLKMSLRDAAFKGEE